MKFKLLKGMLTVDTGDSAKTSSRVCAKTGGASSRTHSCGFSIFGGLAVPRGIDTHAVLVEKYVHISMIPVF